MYRTRFQRKLTYVHGISAPSATIATKTARCGARSRAATTNGATRPSRMGALAPSGRNTAVHGPPSRRFVTSKRAFASVTVARIGPG
jgi:hypothetical protein